MPVEAVVGGGGHNVEPRLRQCVADGCGRAEIGIIAVLRRVLDVDRLLIDTGDVIGFDRWADVGVKGREVIFAARKLRRPVDTVVDEIVAHRHQRDATGLRVRLRLRFGLRLRRDCAERLRPGRLLRGRRSRLDDGCGHGEGRRVLNDLVSPVGGGAVYGKAACRERRQKQRDQHPSEHRSAPFVCSLSASSCHKRTSMPDLILS